MKEDNLFNSSSLFSWREEYNPISFKERKISNNTNHVESRLDKMKNTAKMNGFI